MKIRSVTCALSFVFALGIVGCSGDEGFGQDQGAVKAKTAKTYLALGDSIPFGYDMFVAPGPGSIGYPTYVGAMTDKVVTNAACPGETTASMFDDTAIDNGCDEYKFYYNYLNPTTPFPYATSQLDFAIGYLMQHPETQVVTVQLGANDLLMALHACNDDIACVLTPGPSGYSPLEIALAGVGANLGQTVGTLRYIGYTGTIIMPLYYSTDYADEATTGSIYYLNEVIKGVAAATGARTADVFGYWYMASAPFGGDACAAGLLLPDPINGGCDKHPSTAGSQLIAAAVAAAEGQ